MKNIVELGGTTCRESEVRNIAPNASSSPKADVQKKGNADVKIGAKLPNAGFESIESDGWLLRNHPEVHDDSLDEDAPAHWDERFEKIRAEYDAEHERGRRCAKGEVSGSKRNGESVRSTALVVHTEPRIRRSSTIGQKLTEGWKGFQRLSMTRDIAQQSPTMTNLAESPWTSVKRIRPDENGFPVLDQVQSNMRNALAREFVRVSALEKIRQLPLAERDPALKIELAKKFLSLALGKGGKFNPEDIDSIQAINRHLAKTYGFAIQWPSDVPFSARHPASEESMDFLDALLRDAIHRSANYQVEQVVDLSNPDADPFIQGPFNATIRQTWGNEKVTRQPDQRTDITATFFRDFEHSSYWIQPPDGPARKITAVDDFVKFIGDPKKNELPKLVSHYACQNLGMFIKNLLFAVPDSGRSPLSHLKLFDGTPVLILASPKAKYLLKKDDDGSVTLAYTAAYETHGAAAIGKNTARILNQTGGQVTERSVMIENATAVITLDIRFSPDGTVQMDKLKFNATGWNLVDE